MSVQAQGEDVRKAVKWISDERKHDPEQDINALVDKASAKFDLSPKDAEFLRRFVHEKVS